jgi:cytochrome c oxidase subunit 1
MVAGIAFMFINLLQGLLKGERAPADPWGGTTLEWTISSPPPLHNFADPPRVKLYPYDFSDVKKKKSAHGQV